MKIKIQAKDILDGDEFEVAGNIREVKDVLPHKNGCFIDVMSQTGSSTMLTVFHAIEEITVERTMRLPTEDDSRITNVLTRDGEYYHHGILIEGAWFLVNTDDSTSDVYVDHQIVQWSPYKP